MVLVFGHHLQGLTQNPEQVGEQEVCGGVAALSQPTSICGYPIDAEGHSSTLHQNFLLPISHNLEQDESGNAVEGDGSNEPTPASHEVNASLDDSLMESQPEDTPHSLSEQCELVDPEPTGMKHSKLMVMHLLH